ncbi:hypothetical protein JOQ06_012875, partial [Pogonophryne albipinna]
PGLLMRPVVRALVPAPTTSRRGWCSIGGDGPLTRPPPSPTRLQAVSTLITPPS